MPGYGLAQRSATFRALSHRMRPIAACLFTNQPLLVNSACRDPDFVRLLIATPENGGAAIVAKRTVAARR